MAISVLRNTVGARNPFAHAEVKLGKKIDWRNLSAGEKKKIIEQAFRAPYKEVFNKSRKKNRFLSPVHSGSGDPVLCDTAKVKNMIANWGPDPYGNTYSDTDYGQYDDPVQGALSDCFFVAALTSIATASKTKTKFAKQGAAPFKLLFYDNYKFDRTTGVNSGPTSTEIRVTGDHFPLQGNGNLVFGRSNTVSEIWPSVWEKGYAQWKSADMTTNEPDYSKLCLGNPITALANITGYNFNTGGTATPTVYSTNALSADAVYDKIALACNIAPPAYKTDRATMWPVVAYTYDDQTLGFSNATIVRNHSYAVLGVQNAAAGKYIILRNPWGQVPPPVYVDPNTLDARRCLLDADGNPVICFGDPNLGTDVLCQNTWMGRSLTNVNDGVFGLRTTAFQKYFQGFGWVYY